MTLRKWEYIAQALEHHQAPAEIIEAAKDLDRALVNCGLTHNTPAWLDYESCNSPDREDWIRLDDIVIGSMYCSACTTDNGKTIPCERCELNRGLTKEISCTPEFVYGKDIFNIVKSFVRAKSIKIGGKRKL
ncbi:MAG: hypothetical protein PHH85_14310 [Candidatus Methanoperedens sp.]|nr:hypothetical protein [Candidatus Methanoperedens sp.]